MICKLVALPSSLRAANAFLVFSNTPKYTAPAGKFLASVALNAWYGPRMPLCFHDSFTTSPTLAYGDL